MVDCVLARDSPRTPNQLCRIDSEKSCRICFEPENQHDRLIVPCDCSGSMKFVHEKCMKKAILVKSKRLNQVKCDVCKRDLQMEVKFAFKFNCHYPKEDISKLLLFFLLSCIMSTIIIFILLYLSNPSSKSITAKIYLTIVLIACLSLDLALFFLFYKTFRLACFSLNISKWKIFPIEKPDHLEITNITEILENKENLSSPESKDPTFFIRCEKENIENIENIENNRERIDSSITEACQLTPRVSQKNIPKK
jgi:hypothetical protein